MAKSGVLIAIAAQIALVVWTAFPPWNPELGVPTWHHNVSLLIALAVPGAWALARATKRRAALRGGGDPSPWPRLLDDRAHMGIWVFVWTTLAIVSAFLLLYLKQDLKDWGLKDWAKWWHVAWSWLALVYFGLHTWANRAGYLRSLRRMRAGLGWLTHDGVLLLILLAIPVTWSALGARVFTDPRYIPMTLWTWVAFLLPTYGAWAYRTVRLRQGVAAVPRGLRRPAVQAFVDTWLIPMTILANVSGFPILYFGTKDTSLKYVAKYWHTWPSIAMAILIFAHTVQFWPGVRRHWRHT